MISFPIFNRPKSSTSSLGRFFSGGPRSTQAPSQTQDLPPVDEPRIILTSALPPKKSEKPVIIQSLSRLNAEQMTLIRKAGKFTYQCKNADSSLIIKEFELQIQPTNAQAMMTLTSVGKQHPSAFDLAVLQRKLNARILSHYIHSSKTIPSNYLGFKEGTFAAVNPAEKEKLSTRLVQCHAEVVKIFAAVNKPIRHQISQRLNDLKLRWREIEYNPDKLTDHVHLVLKQISDLKELTDSLNQARAKVAQHIKIRFLVAKQAASTMTIDVLIDGLIATLQEPPGDSSNLLIGGKKAAARFIEQRNVEGFLLLTPIGQNKPTISRIDDLLTHPMVSSRDREQLIALLQSPDITQVELASLLTTLETNKAQAIIADDLRQGIYATLDTSPLTLGERRPFIERLEPRHLAPEVLKDIEAELSQENLKKTEEKITILDFRLKMKDRLDQFLAQQIYHGPFFDRGEHGKHKNGKSYYTATTYPHLLELYRLLRKLAEAGRQWTMTDVQRYATKAIDSMEIIHLENRQYGRWVNLRYWKTFETEKDAQGNEKTLAQILQEKSNEKLNEKIDKIIPILSEVRGKMASNLMRTEATQPKLRNSAEKSKQFALNIHEFLTAAARLHHPPWYEFLKFWKW